MSYKLRQNPANTNNYTKGRPQGAVTHVSLHHAATTDFDGIARTFQNPNGGTSATYGVAPGKVDQYVSENDTPYSDGNWNSNCTTISIESVNSSGAPDWNISSDTIQTLGELMADVAKRRGWKSLKIGQNVKYHSDYYATYCPGKLRDSGLGQKAVDIANKILSGGKPTPAPTPAPSPTPTPSGGNVTKTQSSPGNWRDAPNTSANIFATYQAGATIVCKGYVTGQDPYNDGRNKWAVSANNGKYCWEGTLQGGVSGLKNLGGSSSSGGSSASSSQRVAQNGTFKAYGGNNIRRSPSTSGQIVGQLSAGETVQYDSYIDNEGYRWISYIGYSGNRNYVARRKLDNSAVYGDAY